MSVDSRSVALDGAEISGLQGLIRRRHKLMALGALIGGAIGALYILRQPLTYEATASLVVENRKIRAVQDAYAYSSGDISSSDNDINTLIELLRSERIAARVIQAVGINVDPTARDGTSMSWRQRLASYSPIAPPPAKLDQSPEAVAGRAQAHAIADIQQGLTVRRVPRSSVVELVYTSNDQAKSTRLASAFATAYFAHQQAQQKQATDYATGWLGGQIEDVKGRLLAAEQASQRYRTERGIVAAGGRIVDDQRLADANTLLTQARSETQRLAARYAKIKTVLDKRNADSAVSDAWNDSIISQVRSKYLTASLGEQQIAAQLGKSHAAAGKLRAEKIALEKLMFKEIGRLSGSIRNELEIATTREAEQEASYETLVQANSASSEASIQLRELERNADALRAAYNALLQRKQEAVQQNSFSNINAQLINSGQATPTYAGPSWRDVIFGTTLLGFGLGGLAGLLRELRDDSFRSRRQAGAALGIESVWTMPHDPSLVALKPGHPPTGYARQALEAVRLELDRALASRQCRRIGVVGFTERGGSSTLACGLASIIAGPGATTLLVDGDLKQRSIARKHAPKLARGLVERVASGDAPSAAVVQQAPGEHTPAFTVLGSADKPTDSGTLASPEFEKAFRDVTDAYRYVVVDLPPLSSSMDAEAMAAQVDAFLLVGEWGITSRTEAAQLLDNAPQVRDKCLGLILNKTSSPELALYERNSPQLTFHGHSAATP